MIYQLFDEIIDKLFIYLFIFLLLFANFMIVDSISRFH